MNTLINSIYESKGDMKQELIELMNQEIKETKNIVLGDIRRLFIMVGEQLKDENKEIILATHQLVMTLLQHLLQSEAENGFKIIHSQLISNLADSDGKVRKSTKLIFITFIQKTRDIEQVLDLLTQQFKSKNFYVRERAINLVPDILLAGSFVFSSRTGVNEARKIIEALIIHTNDVNQSVKTGSINALRKIKYIENFDQVYRRLATEHQLILDKIQRELPPKKDKFIELNLQSLGDEMYTNTEFIPSEFLYKRCYDLSDFPQDLITKRYFGFLSEEILKDTLNVMDLAVRERGIIELNNQFFEDAEEEISINSAVVEKIVNGGFMPAFFKYISSLFTSKDFRVVNVLLNVISKIMQVPGIHVNVYLPLCLGGLIECLADDRVVIRKRALFLLRQMVKYLKRKQYFQNLIFFLEQRMENWHKKEELLNLISYLILCIDPTEAWFYVVEEKEPQVKQDLKKKVQKQEQYNLQEVDFKKALRQIAFFLDDQVSKVKYASLECLAVLSYCNRKHLDFLHEVLDQQIYDKLVDKVDNNIVYFINDNGNLELPQINIRKLEEERQSFVSKMAESLPVPEEPEPLIPQTPQSEESAKSNYKVTYYYDKFPISMRDKIKLSNQSLDRLFASEHKNFETTKYDLVIQEESAKGQGKENFHLVNSNIYIQKEMPKIEDPYRDEIMSDSEGEDDEQRSIELEYPVRTLKHRGHPPDQMTKSKFQPIEDVKQRVFKTMKQLNEDVNVDLQIPKMIKANVGAYQGYKFEGENDEEEEIFVDTKQIHQDHKLGEKTNFQKQPAFPGQALDKKTSAPRQLAQYEKETIAENMQEIFKHQQMLYTPEQRYQKRLEEFLLYFEDRDQKSKGRNARKIRRKIVEQRELTNYLNFPVRIDNPRAETSALIVNLSSLDVYILMTSLSKLQLLLANHLDQVYASQANLLQIVNDVCRLLSTQTDNPLYSADFKPYKQHPSELIREIVYNALVTLRVAVTTLRSSLVHVPKMFGDAGVWLQDENNAISQEAELALIDIIRNCDDSQLSDILPKLYDKQSFNSKIRVGVLLEELVNKHQGQIFNSPHIASILHLISQMVVDISFDVRRQGKKVFFKMLGHGSEHVRDVITTMHEQEKNHMRALLRRYEELVADHQIGIFDQDQYMEKQVTPVKLFELDDLDMII